MRIAAKRRSTVSCHRPERNQDDSSLESVLHDFLTTAPKGAFRCRKNTLPAVKASSAVCSFKTIPPVGKTDTPPCSGQDLPETKQPKLQKEEEPLLGSKEEAEKMREITRKVLHYQNSCDGDKVNGTPQQVGKTKETAASPRTPLPRSRDYFFANNPGSPWTILSPLTCSPEDSSPRNRRAHHLRRPLSLGGDDLDDGVWESNPSSQDTATSSSCASSSLPECPSKRAASRAPILRSVSVDEARRSPATLSRLGELFHRNTSQRSQSSGSRTEVMKEAGEKDRLLLSRKIHVEGQVSSSGFRSFFRRIGGRNKLEGVDQQHFKGQYT